MNLEVDESSKLVQVGLPVTGSIVLLVVWQVLTGVLGVLDPSVLPSPVQIAETYPPLAELILTSLLDTLTASAIGFIISVSLALAFSVVMVANDEVNDALLPILVSGNSVPRIALAPIIIFYVGGDAQAKYLISAWVAFFPMLVNALDGFKNVDSEVMDLLRLFESSTWQEFKFVRIPSALPYIFDGLKIASILAIIGAVVAEFIVSNSGIGYLAMIAMLNLEMSFAFAVVITTGLVSTTVFFLLFLLQDRLIYWKETDIFPE